MLMANSPAFSAPAVEAVVLAATANTVQLASLAVNVDPVTVIVVDVEPPGESAGAVTGVDPDSASVTV